MLTKHLQRFSRRSNELPDAALVELVDVVFRALPPIAIMGVTMVGIGALLTIRTGDSLLLLVTLAGAAVSAARIALMLLYRRRRAASRPTASEARRWDRRYALGSFAFAALLGALNARALTAEAAVADVMLSPMLVTTLILAYGAGVVTRLSARPQICLGSVTLATMPTVAGFGMRALGAEGWYAQTVFATQAAVVGVFAMAGLGLVDDFYDTVRQQIVAKLDLAALAGRDHLTGLANRIRLQEKLEEAGAHLERAGGLFALHYLDLDRFKEVNDNFGHITGDALLQAVAERLTQTVREGDTVARLGGDEFVIIQLGIQVAEEAELLGRRIVQAIGAPYDLAGRKIHIGVSGGVALAPRDGTRLEQLVSCADSALYRTKRKGRGERAFWGEEGAQLPRSVA
ncbi:diguanylate cyclase domain-containing protein [Methylosinus sporium]|uniref:diguanylate cyclase domain-containing protein n=1 Tax=Methylosinus sporium TaxID=428 RepID=UPI00383AF822